MRDISNKMPYTFKHLAAFSCIIYYNNHIMHYHNFCARAAAAVI